MAKIVDSVEALRFVLTATKGDPNIRAFEVPRNVAEDLLSELDRLRAFVENVRLILPCENSNDTCGDCEHFHGLDGDGNQPCRVPLPFWVSPRSPCWPWRNDERAKDCPCFKRKAKP